MYGFLVCSGLCPHKTGAQNPFLNWGHQTFIFVIVYILLGISPASNCSWPTFRNPASVPSSKAGCSLSTSSLWRWNWHRVPKRRPTTIWRRGNTQKNIYNIQITAKVWNLEFIFVILSDWVMLSILWSEDICLLYHKLTKCSFVLVGRTFWALKKARNVFDYYHSESIQWGTGIHLEEQKYLAANKKERAVGGQKRLNSFWHWPLEKWNRDYGRRRSKRRKKEQKK